MSTSLELFIALSASTLIGVSIGLFGAGGSILIMPVLVYALDLQPSIAITYSLGIVGLSSSISAFKASSRTKLQILPMLALGAPAMLTTLATRSYFIPILPTMFTIGEVNLNRESCTMMILALLMLIAAWRMIFQREGISNVSSFSIYYLIASGIGIGLITGFTGIGGGFLIVPLMIFISGMSMQEATYASMILIALNTLPSFAIDLLSGKSIHYPLFVTLALFSILGSFGGIFIARFIQQQRLKQLFGMMIAFLAFYIFINEL